MKDEHKIRTRWYELSRMKLTEVEDGHAWNVAAHHFASRRQPRNLVARDAGSFRSRSFQPVLIARPFVPYRYVVLHAGRMRFHLEADVLVIERSLGWNSIEVIQVSFVNPLGIATHVHSTRPSAGKRKPGGTAQERGFVCQPPHGDRPNGGGDYPFTTPAPAPTHLYTPSLSRY